MPAIERPSGKYQVRVYPRVSLETLAKLQQAADAHGTTPATLARHLIEVGLQELTN